jgi:hypothetical protein
MAGQQLCKRAIQELMEDTPPIGSKGGEPPLSSLFFSRHALLWGCRFHEVPPQNY